MTDQQNATAEALEAFAAETRSVTIAGKEYEVKRLESRQFWPILRSFLPIIEGLGPMLATASSPADSPLGSTAAKGPALDVPPAAKSGLEQLLGTELAWFVKVMAEHGERVDEVIACALDEKVTAIRRAEPQETYLAMRAIFEVNRDFFIRKVLPLLGLQGPEAGQGSVLAAAIAKAQVSIGAGPTPSSS